MVIPSPGLITHKVGVQFQGAVHCEWIKLASDYYIIVGRVVAANVDDRVYRRELSRLVIDLVYHVAADEDKCAGKGRLPPNE